MKIFISADMEGATGVVHSDQLMPSGKTYEAARKLLTSDVNAAIEGALRVEPDAEFLVCDGHGVMRNILLEELHQAARLIMGPASYENRPLCQVQGIDGSFDLGFFVAYHSRAGTPGGLLSHTWAGAVVTNFRINGEPVGETALNASVLGDYDVPVGLLTGASELGVEGEATIPGGFVFVETKKSLGRTGAICLPPRKTLPMIKDGAEEATRRYQSGKL